ncbi:MAG: Ig-like domain-containing protein [Kofleriaceae bacterium]
MKRLVVGAICVLSFGAASASAETRTTFPQQGDSINEDTSPVVTNGFGRPRLERVWMDVDPGQFSGGPVAAVNSNKIYLNNCKPNGCVIRSGGASSIDGSGYQGTWGISGQRTLTAFNQSDTVWNNVVTCMRDVFSRFGVEIVTTNPSPAAHFEIMIAGSPTNIGLSNGIGGISPFSCQQYIPNSLVFAFANISLYQNDPEEICATAQEIAHSFALDHVTDPSDPLTYFNYNGRRQFKDANVNCGSDCVGGQSPMGLTCTGSNQQTHACACGGATQNSVAKIKALFGSGTPTPPTIKITSPLLGESVAPGFPIRVEASDDNGIGNVTGYIDGVANLAPMAIVTAPYAFNAPTTLANGTHTIRMVATDIYGTQAEASVQVIIGDPCTKPADCPNDTDTCIGGRCVTGPGVQGGLGSTCNSGIDCASGQCAQDSTGAKHCVEQCAIDEGQCPEGFGCLPTGDNGVCWPGYDDGSGGICSAGGPGGQVTLGLAFAALVFTRRRRRRVP